MKRSSAIIGFVITGLLVVGSYEAAAIWLGPQQNGSAVFDPTNEIHAACNYLLSNYNSSVGLVAETPAHQKYWLYSDNFLVHLAFESDCGKTAAVDYFDKDIWFNHVARHEYPNQYLVLSGTLWDFNGSRDYNIYGNVWATINNQTGTLSPDDYADIGFLQALYFAYPTATQAPIGGTTPAGTHDAAQADALFLQAVDKYNGTGFIDKPFQSQKEFQTYKLALYIYVARFLHHPFLQNALTTLLRMQDSNGGFHTGYLSDYSTDDTSVNTETTCLTILALSSLTWASSIGELPG